MDMFHTKGAALLVEAILSLKNEEECRAFLEDVMTGKRFRTVASGCWWLSFSAVRWSTARLPRSPAPAVPPSVGSIAVISTALVATAQCCPVCPTLSAMKAR